MQKVIVFGVPDDADKEKLINLHAKMVDVFRKFQKLEPKDVMIFFPKDQLQIDSGKKIMFIVDGNFEKQRGHLDVGYSVKIALEKEIKECFPGAIVDSHLND